tara:strand:- start:90 stop:194 length:105 start_codon:yes stop_codon:yes gene_type:complete
MSTGCIEEGHEYFMNAFAESPSYGDEFALKVLLV